MGESWQQIFGRDLRVVSLPTRSHPRLVIISPTAHQRWAASKAYPASRGFGRVAKAGYRLLAASGITTQSGAGTELPGLWDALEAVFPGGSVRLAFVAPASFVQKVTLQIVDPTGVPMGFAKIGLHEDAAGQVRREADFLAGLPSRLAPSPVAHRLFPWGAALFLEALPGFGLRPKMSIPQDLLSTLMTLPKHPLPAGDEHPWLSARADGLPLPEIRSAIAMLAERDSPTVLAHGDLAPWNVLVSDGHHRLIDWEYGTLAGFPHADATHFLLQVASFVKRWPPDRSRDFIASRLAESPIALAAAQAHALVTLVAAQAYARSASEGATDKARVQVWRRQLIRSTW